MYLLSTMAQASSEGLTFREVLSEIPTDAASVFVYLLLAVCVGVIWYTNRGTGGRTPGGGAVS